MRQRKTLIAIIILLVIGMWGSRALFKNGFYTSHDGWHQVARLYHFDQLIKVGQIPPRHSFDLLFGNGYPLFIFSYHAPWILAEPLLLAGVSIFDAIKWVFIIVFTMSAVTMFLWQRKLWGDLGGFVAGIFYIWAPYRFSTTLVRAALGEATSFVFIPLLFYSLHRLSTNSKSKFPIIIGAIGLAGFVLSHSMVVFLLGTLVFSYLGFLIYTCGNRIAYIKNIVAMFVLGSLLSAYYVIPAFVYQPITVFKDVQRMFFQQQFLSLKDLLYSSWGYAASFTGVGQMSLQLGIGQWLSVFISMNIFIYIFFSHRKELLKRQVQLALIFFANFILLAFMTTPYSKGVWEGLRNYIPIDFPWRLLSILTLLSATLSGFIVGYTSGRIKKITLFVLLFVCFYTTRNYQRVNQYTQVPLSLYIASERTTNTFDEYLPRWARISEVTKENRIPYETDSSVVITHLQQNAREVSLKALSSGSASFILKNIYFPGMKLFINNRATLFSYKENGYINFKIPPGESEIELKMLQTSPEILGNMLTLLGIILLLIILIRESMKIKLSHFKKSL